MTTISKENTTPEVNEAVSSEPMFTKKDLRKMCWRSLPGGFSVNWDRYVHKTFTFMIAPMLKRIKMIMRATSRRYSAIWSFSILPHRYMLLWGDSL